MMFCEFPGVCTGTRSCTAKRAYHVVTLNIASLRLPRLSLICTQIAFCSHFFRSHKYLEKDALDCDLICVRVLSKPNVYDPKDVIH